MKKLHFSNRGQVLIIFVFAIIGLVGMTGLAIDGSNIYSDRRHAQNAADTAVLAAALTRNNLEEKELGANELECTTFDLDPVPLCAWRSIQAALDMAATNGYSNNIIDSTVEVFSPPVDGPYADCYTYDFDCNEYIEVKIHTNVNTYFARVLGIPQLHNTVWAVALAKYDPEQELYGGNTLVQLASGHGHCPSDFDVSGSGSVTLNGGGIFVNSPNPACAYKQTSCNTTITLAGDPPATIQVVGGADLNSCNSPPIGTTTTTYPFPPAHLLDPPDECNVTGTFAPEGTKTTRYHPGSYYGYTKFPVNNDNALLDPGVYCVQNLKNSAYDITGNGVMFYIRPTGQVDISGGNIILSAATSGEYAGYLIYGDWNLTSTPQTCTIAGNEASQYTGLIFVPYCDMNLTGTSSETGINTQLVAYTIRLGGTLDLTFTYDASKFPTIPEINKTGLYH